MAKKPKKKEPAKLNKKQREEAERKSILAAVLAKIAKRLEKEAGDAQPDAGGHPVEFTLRVDNSTVSVGLPTTGKQGYQFGLGDVLIAALYHAENSDEMLVWAIDTLKEAKKDAELSAELKGFGKTVAEKIQTRQRELKLLTPASTSKGARTATIGELQIDAIVASQSIDIAIEGDG